MLIPHPCLEVLRVGVLHLATNLSLLRETLGTVTSLLNVCHRAMNEVYGESVPAVPVHSAVDFPFTQHTGIVKLVSGFLSEGIVHV